MLRPLLVALLFGLLSCASLNSNSWATFQASPEDAEPAIIQALSEEGLEVAGWDRAARKITTRWSVRGRSRLRFELRWVPEAPEMMTILIRSERERRTNRTWAPVGRDHAREDRLLNRITAALQLILDPPS